MKKISLSHLANMWAVYTAYIAAITLVYVLTLFALNTTYDKFSKQIANRDYVREVTRWPGHVRVVNIPVEYTLYTIMHIIKVCISLKCLKLNIMWSDTTIENNEHSGV